MRHGYSAEHISNAIANAEKYRIRNERELEDRLHGRVNRPLEAGRVSFDHGGSWKLVVLCDECIAGIEEPTRLKREGATGARTCDWCGARAMDYRPEG